MTTITNSPAMTKETPGRTALDWCGVAASTACLIHCVALPFVVLLAPVIAGQWLFGEVAGRLLAVATASIGLGAAAVGRARHGRRMPIALAAVGVAFLLVAEWLVEGIGWAGPLLATAGGASLIGAHAYNIVLLRRCARCAPSVEAVPP